MKIRKITIFIVLFLAFAPVAAWYCSRLGDGSGEPLGLIALVLALGFALQTPHSAIPRLAEVALLVYGVGLFFLPPLLRAVPALTCVAFLFGIHRSAGQSTLLFLSLPLQASLDFFLGYPFRFITAEGSRLTLNLIGQPVERLGVQLSLNEIFVSVDPPCSGLQMLWAAAFLTGLLATLFKLNYRSCFVLGLVALALCLGANILRATTLFFPEAGLITIPEFTHEGVGLVIFLLASLFLVRISRGLQAKAETTPTEAPIFPPRLLASASGVFLLTLLPAQSSEAGNDPQFETLTIYRGQPVEEVPLSTKEESFAQNFPGQLKVYRAGENTLIIRQVTKATRMLHPGRHCLRAEGFLISDCRLTSDHKGRQVTSYRATRNNEAYLVREFIRSLRHERSWTEVSAWYWHALFNPKAGPWEAQTILTPTTRK